MGNLQSDTHTIFSESGPLASHHSFEYRPQQAAMADAIAGALEHAGHLIIEAPTGVGKTLAYLIPAILYASREHRKAVVSTHTKNLQEQIFREDLPRAQSILGLRCTATTLKGRKNYLCTTRLRHALASPGHLFDRRGQQELGRIEEWSVRSVDGDIETLGFVPDPEIWAMVCSEQGVCAPRLCDSSCFYQRIKDRAREADLVITNHALFFTLATLQGGEDRFIFDNDFVIFDEAQTLEAVASHAFGKSLSRYQVLSAIHRCYNPGTKKGLLANERRTLKSLCRKAESAAQEFFDAAYQAAARGQPAPVRGSQAREIRIRHPRLVVNILSGPLSDLHSRMEELEGIVSDPGFKQELAAARRLLWEAQLLVDELLEQVEPRFAYWIELAGQRSDNITFYCSPAEPSEMLGPFLFREGTPVILTSATLSVNNSMEYIHHRLGARDVDSLQLDSPFDPMRQMRLCIARDIPEPDSPGYEEALPEWILRSIDWTRGKALVLFTSTSLMRSVAASLAEECSSRGIRLLVQGTDMDRHQLLVEFKRDIYSVLFGLDSFWMGVDVPGEALEHVIITRLPFSAPGHPLIEARLEAIGSRGGSPFAEYTLPEAVLKLRQGVGRLIRTRSDRGIVTILDSRLLRKRYGTTFLSSLPRCPIELLSSSGEVEELHWEGWNSL